jgi:flagellar basal body-associated protein FliL
LHFQPLNKDRIAIHKWEEGDAEYGIIIIIIIIVVVVVVVVNNNYYYYFLSFR